MIVIKINISFAISLKCSLFILADYFSINQEDHITNQSYIETSRISACASIHLTFSSKVHYLGKEISLILLTYQGNTWKKSWEYMHNDSQWGLHQLSLNISETKEDIRVNFFFLLVIFFCQSLTFQLRYLPSSPSSDRISLDMTVPMISTNPNCTFNQTSTPFNSSSSDRRTPSIHFFLVIIFGSLFLLLFIGVMIVFIYNLINKQYNRWLRKRSSRQRRKTTNVVGDESTVLGLETDTV